MATYPNIPRITIAALKGGAGKTFVTIALAAALRNRGMSPALFKKGPDYIDAGWLGSAAGGVCYNLDPYLFDTSTVRSSFLRRARDGNIAIVEGNRGLFDGVDSSGSYSTAELAKVLDTPVLLVVDATKVTRTAAALVLGCKVLDPAVDLRGVILNRVAGARHERVLRESIEAATGIPVIGAIKRLGRESFPQRHLGLLPLYEHPRAKEFIEEAAGVATESLDLARIISIAESAGPMAWDDVSSPARSAAGPMFPGIRVGVLKDSAFQFYYPENLEALQARGAELTEISALTCATLPELDALYIGGGFPETHAQQLADNVGFKESIRRAVAEGLPVYAECGGLMYLSKHLVIDEQSYPMVGVLPVSTALERTPQGHGYIRVEVGGRNPFYPHGTVLTGHEFHYSYVTGLEGEDISYAFRVLRGHGIDGEVDGICVKNVLATYVHVHALGEPLWAEGLLRKAVEFRESRTAECRDSRQLRTDARQCRSGEEICP
ncbi:MAG: cobyrinate a,c-diamide synthase [Thermodesulfobacteriota bacterium]